MAPQPPQAIPCAAPSLHLARRHLRAGRPSPWPCSAVRGESRPFPRGALTFATDAVLPRASLPRGDLSVLSPHRCPLPPGVLQPLQRRVPGPGRTRRCLRAAGAPDPGAVPPGHLRGEHLRAEYVGHPLSLAVGEKARVRLASGLVPASSVVTLLAFPGRSVLPGQRSHTGGPQSRVAWPRVAVTAHR